jgi:hypothetical protein
MDLERFSQLVEAYGGDPQHWAEDERAAALDFLQHSAHAKFLQQEALKLDHLLSFLPEVSASATLEQRIFSQVIHASSDISLLMHIQILWENYCAQHVWRIAAVCILPLCIGILVGLALPAHHIEHNQQIAEETEESTQRVNRFAAESIALVEFAL